MTTLAGNEAIQSGILINQRTLLKMTITAMTGIILEESVGSNAKMTGMLGIDGYTKRLCSNTSGSTILICSLMTF